MEDQSKWLKGQKEIEIEDEKLSMAGLRAYSLRYTLIQSIEDRQQEIESLNDNSQPNGDAQMVFNKKKSINLEINKMIATVKTLNYIFCV